MPQEAPTEGEDEVETMRGALRGAGQEMRRREGGRKVNGRIQYSPRAGIEMRDTETGPVRGQDNRDTLTLSRAGKEEDFRRKSRKKKSSRGEVKEDIACREKVGREKCDGRRLGG